MEPSILKSVKKMLGLGADYTPFDMDVIIHINTVMMFLNQLGVTKAKGFMIEDDSVVWTDVLEDRFDLEAIKTYIYLRVRLIFDPPTSSFVLESMQKQINELEWRINVQVENVVTL